MEEYYRSRGHLDELDWTTENKDYIVKACAFRLDDFKMLSLRIKYNTNGKYN